MSQSIPSTFAALWLLFDPSQRATRIPGLASKRCPLTRRPATRVTRRFSWRSTAELRWAEDTAVEPRLPAGAELVAAAAIAAEPGGTVEEPAAIGAVAIAEAVKGEEDQAAASRI